MLGDLGLDTRSSATYMASFDTLPLIRLLLQLQFVEKQVANWTELQVVNWP